MLCFFLLLACSSWAKDDNKEWKQSKSEHFFVYYKDTSEDFVKKVISSAEEYYKNITTDFGFSRFKGWAWNGRAKIFIYDTKDEYKKRSSFGWAAGEVDVLQKKIITYPSEAGFFDSVLPHELTHIILREFIGTEDNIPLWFEEGGAMYGEKARRLDANHKVRALLLKGADVSVQWLTSVRLGSNTDQATVSAFYAASASLFSFLIKELEPYRFARLCVELKKGIGFEKALGNSCMRLKKSEDLQREWMRYLGYDNKRK